MGSWVQYMNLEINGDKAAFWGAWKMISNYISLKIYTCIYISYSLHHSRKENLTERRQNPPLKDKAIDVKVKVMCCEWYWMHKTRTNWTLFFWCKDIGNFMCEWMGYVHNVFHLRPSRKPISLKWHVILLRMKFGSRTFLSRHSHNTGWSRKYFVLSKLKVNMGGSLSRGQCMYKFI